MLTHVVLFTLHDPADRERVLAGLRDLGGNIPSLLSLSVGGDELRGPNSADLALVSTHEDLEGLKAYQEHPLHQELLTWLAPLLATRVVVDSLDMS